MNSAPFAMRMKWCCLSERRFSLLHMPHTLRIVISIASKRSATLLSSSSSAAGTEVCDKKGYAAAHILSHRISDSKTQAQFQGMEVRNSNFTAFIDFFTTNTYIMVIMSDPANQTATIQLNIRAARQVFEQHVQQTN